jgi:hypothetical protein
MPQVTQNSPKLLDQMRHQLRTIKMCLPPFLFPATFSISAPGGIASRVGRVTRTNVPETRHSRSFGLADHSSAQFDGQIEVRD